MKDQQLWNLSREAWTALGPHYEPVIERIIEQSGLEGRGWGLLLATLTFEPEDTTVPHLMVRGPYTAAEIYLARLHNAAILGFLAEVSPGAFRLTPSGRKATMRFIQEARQAMSSVDPLTPDEAKLLTRQFERLVQNILDTPPPPDTWSIRLSYKLMPELDQPLPYIEQSLSCLAGYRDDAHLAAWRQTGLSATALETLTLLWRGKVGSFDDLIEQLSYRGHSAEVYLDAIVELRRRKFIAGTKRTLRVTSEGQKFREQVESDTDRYFYAPWSCLSAADKHNMKRLLTSLRDGLNS